MSQEGSGDYGKIGKENTIQARFRGPKAFYTRDRIHKQTLYDEGMQGLLNTATHRYPQITEDPGDRGSHLLRMATIPVAEIDGSSVPVLGDKVFNSIKAALGIKLRKSAFGDWRMNDTLVVVAQPIETPDGEHDIHVAGICMSPDEFNTFKVLLKDPRDPKNGLEATKELYRFITNTGSTATELFRITGIQ